MKDCEGTHRKCLPFDAFEAFRIKWGRAANISLYITGRKKNIVYQNIKDSEVKWQNWKKCVKIIVVFVKTMDNKRLQELGYVGDSVMTDYARSFWRDLFWGVCERYPGKCPSLEKMCQDYFPNEYSQGVFANTIKYYSNLVSLYPF